MSWLSSRKRNAWKSEADLAFQEAFSPMECENVPSLEQFILDGWPVLEPATPLEPNWHIGAVTIHLEAAIDDWIAIQKWRTYQQSALVTALVGTEKARAAQIRAEMELSKPLQRIQNLLINIPPGTAKSRIISVFFPAWVWLKWPAFKWIYLSSNPRVAERDSILCNDLIASDWYRNTFKPAWRIRQDKNGKKSFWNTAGGIRSSFGFFSRITGDRADAIVWDDPHDADQVHSDRLRQAVLDKWDGAIGNRVNDQRTSLRIGIMQRLHEEDLSGHVLKRGGWEHLCLPMEFEKVPACKCLSCQRGHTVIGWKDPRTEDGELLFEQRFPRTVLDSERLRMGEAGYAGQMQQRPAPAGGDIFKVHWWRFWVPLGCTLAPPKVRLESGDWQEAQVVELPAKDPHDVAWDDSLQSWDMTFKETKGADFVAGGVWGKLGANKYLLHQVRERMSFVKTKAAVEKMSAEWPSVHRKLIEDKANGPAVISALRDKVPGLIAIEPEGSKQARAHAVTPDIEAGNVLLPHPDLPDYGWVNLFLAECTQFPYAAKDDQVDEMTQALRRFQADNEGTGVTAVLPSNRFGGSNRIDSDSDFNADPREDDY